MKCGWCGYKCECPECGKISHAEKIKVTVAERGIKFGRPRKHDYAKIRKLRANGMSIKAIAKEIGSNRWTVRAALNEKPPAGAGE